MKRAVAPFLLIALFASGCTEAVVFQEDAQIPNGQWERGWNPTFSFEVTDTVNAHDVYLDVRHTGDYPFSNLFTFVKLTGPGGEHLTDTVECTLADPTGRWYGKGTGFVNSYRAHVLYKMRNRFPRTGRYSIQLEQAMRRDTLPGVMDVGISVERSQTDQ